MKRPDLNSPTGEWFLYPWADGTMRAYWVRQIDRDGQQIQGEIKAFQVLPPATGIASAAIAKATGAA